MHEEIKPGIYKHFKGGEYQFLFIAFNEKDQKETVVYKSLKDNKIWFRDIDNFKEEIEVDGKKIKRFKFIKDIQDDDFEGMYKRALADYQNLLKQSAKEKQEFVKYANEQLLLEIVPIYNNLRLALIHGDEKASSWLEGINHIIRQFKNFLESVGVEEIKVVNQKFDHNLMDAVSQEETDKKELDDVVFKEIQFGYKLNGKVIIPAKVVVYKHKV